MESRLKVTFQKGLQGLKSHINDLKKEIERLDEENKMLKKQINEVEQYMDNEFSNVIELSSKPSPEKIDKTDKQYIFPIISTQPLQPKFRNYFNKRRNQKMTKFSPIMEKPKITIKNIESESESDSEAELDKGSGNGVINQNTVINKLLLDDINMLMLNPSANNKKNDKK
jgi:hypothetical protein